jgi:hypothetical protein
LIDAFLLAQKNRDFIGSNLLQRNAIFETGYKSATIGFGRPGIARVAHLTDGTAGQSYQPVMSVVALNIGL